MLDDQRYHEIIQRHTRGLMEEARTYMTGPPEIWAAQIGQWTKIYEQKIDHSIWLSETQAEPMHVDLLVFHQFPTTIGQVFAVQPYDRFKLGSTEFMAVFDRVIPTAVYTIPVSGPKSVRWTCKKIKTEKYLRDFVSQLNETLIMEEPLNGNILAYANYWYQTIRGVNYLLPYTMQLVPINRQQTLLLYKRTYDRKINKRSQRIYHIGEFLLLVENVFRLLDYVKLPSNFVLKPEVPIPTWSALAIPEIAKFLPTTSKHIQLPQQPTEPYMHFHEGLTPKEGYLQTRSDELIQCPRCRQWFPPGEQCPYCQQRIL
jgi:hypothetical protein